MKRRDNQHQLVIDWEHPQPSSMAALHQPKQLASAPSPLVQRLPWDFTTTFPQPLDQAIDTGIIDESDREPENLKSLHENYSRECLALLKSLDAVADARRRGIDPVTRKPPKTRAAREKLRRSLAEQPDRLQHAFDVLIETYGTAFGADAAAPFAKYIQARHAGIPIEIATESERIVPPRRKRISTAFPVPKPLPKAVAAGHFGEENGKPINPTPDEVAAITEDHAEKIIELLDQRCEDHVKPAIEKYVASFGQQAGERLEAYARRQQRLNASHSR